MPNKLGIIAGNGALPERIVEACRSKGRECFVLALKGHTNPKTVANVPHAWVRLGAVGAAIKLLHEAGVEDLVLAGPVGRPTLASLRPDVKGAMLLAKAGVASLSDDGLLRMAIKALETEGFCVVGAEDVFDELLTPEGVLGKLAPDRSAEADITRGVEIARAIGFFDVGQAVIVQQGIVLGVEAVEGTDALIDRAGRLRREGPGGVLVKIKKPTQEVRADLPTIGMATVQAVAKAGLCGIAVEAGGSLIIDRTRVIEAADRAGLFLVGIKVPL
ncbi:UDP-2,3-diacylglucosamine diphosphatase LpxI [Rhodospirillaceae bacterium AH-315-P19]|nr:UDP-2,3-diacylglucosamine diphosphatase LpxI [Rhodospirillaceae bacterium AH-315-P19]